MVLAAQTSSINLIPKLTCTSGNDLEYIVLSGQVPSNFFGVDVNEELNMWKEYIRTAPENEYTAVLKYVYDAVTAIREGRIERIMKVGRQRHLRREDIPLPNLPFDSVSLINNLLYPAEPSQLLNLTFAMKLAAKRSYLESAVKWAFQPYFAETYLKLPTKK